MRTRDDLLSQGPSQLPIQLAARRGARRQRRHPVDGEPRLRRGGVWRFERAIVTAGDRRPGRRRAVDGGRRVRVGQLAARRRAGRYSFGGARAASRPARRAARARGRRVVAAPERATECYLTPWLAALEEDTIAKNLPHFWWAGRPDRPAPRYRRVVRMGCSSGPRAGVAFEGPSCEVRSIAGGFDLGIVQLDLNGRLRFSS